MRSTRQTQKRTGSVWQGLIASLGICLVVLGGLAGPAHALPQVETAATTASQEAIADTDIAAAVLDELKEARGVTAGDLYVTVEEGVVTVSGTVGNALAKDRSVRIARSVKGVRSVVNRVQVQPPEVPAETLRGNVAMALASDPATEPWEIEVAVSDNVVTLSGEVDSWQEKRLAETVAKGVRGVRAIDNDLAVPFQVERPDDEIKEDVEQTLRWDVRIDDGLIDVDVIDSEVYLSGTVGSAYEAFLAVEKAWVNGVLSVQAPDLNVEWWARDAMQRTEWAGDLSSDAIQNAVKDALRADPRVAAFEVDVVVEDGVATLFGTVDNVKAKQAAAQDAGNTVGVFEVRNNLVVEAPDRPADDVIAADVRTRLDLDPYVDKYEIEVDVADGVVMLDGAVDSFFERWQAGDIAARAQGARTIQNYLDVDYTPPRHDLTAYDWDPIASDLDVEVVEERFSDLDIREDIQDELWWSPFVDEDEVTVTVDEGEATLTGTVDSQSARAAATEEALEGGALAVTNLLTVASDAQPN